MDFLDDLDYDEEDDLDLGDDGYDFSVPKARSLRPYHLNSALTPYWFELLQAGRPEKKIRNSLREITNVVRFEINEAVWEPMRFYLLFGACSIIIDPLSFEDDALEMCTILNDAEQLAWQGRTDNLSRMLTEQTKLALGSGYYKYYNLQSNMFSTLVLIMNALSSKRNLPKLVNVTYLTKDMIVVNLPNGYSLYVTEQLVLGIRGSRTYLMNYDSMLMCSDLAKQRRLVMGMTYVGNKLFPENYPSQSTLGELLEIVDDGMRAHGNEFYKVVKTFEPLCVGAIMKTKEDHFVDNSEFFKTILEDLEADTPHFLHHIRLLVSFLTSELNPRWLAQYFGLYRIWGHPIVDVPSGIKKVMDLGLKETVVNEHSVLVAERHFKYIMLTNYKSKHHVYPNFTILGKENGFLVTSLKLNRDLPKPGSKWYLHDLDYIDFAETFKPPATFNLTSIIADKAVSPSRSEFQKLILQGKNMDPQIRRGVLKWLGYEQVSCKEILRMVNGNEFPDDWCIIGVYPKEREENIKPRLFALMSFELRIYVVVTEEMLSDHILDYFPQITMTHSQLDLTKNIFTATRHQSTEYSKKQSNLVTISLSMDFEKWNIKMRKSATIKVFRQLGLLFGMENLYVATHDILSRCYIYLADGSFTPDKDLTPDFVRSWIGHLGGFEGLRQKGWTIFTACLIDYVCSSRDVSFRLMGQGDNQVVQLIFRLNHTQRGSDGYDPRDISRIKSVTQSILVDLEQIFTSVGMTLKISETWRSSHLFSYGKNMVFDGVPLPLSLKKGARAFYESNEGVMVVDSMLSTVNTNCQASAYQDLSHHIAHHVGRIESYIMCRKLIEYHPLLGSGLRVFEGKKWSSRRILVDPPLRIPESKYLAAAMIVVPRMLGGYNTTCLFEFIMRGFPDPVTRDLAYTRMLLKGLMVMQKEEAQRVLEHVAPWYDLQPNGTVDKSFLVQDPLALNLLGPRSPMDAMRGAVEAILQSSDVKNQPFKKLLALKNRSALTDISEALWSAKRLNARLGHDIYQATPFGYITQSISRIENTNTIRNIAYKRTNKDIIELVCEAEVNKYLFFIWKCTQYHPDRIRSLLQVCTRVYADKIREISWGKPIVGVTVPFPDEYLCMSREATRISGTDQDGYFIVGFNEHSLRGRESMISTLGPSPPYLGSVTREKTRQTADATVFKAESLIRRPLKLQRSIGWFVPEESNMAKLIQRTLSCVTDLDPVDFKTTDWESTGSHIHRYHDTVTKKGVLINYSYLPGTHMYLSTDLLVKYSQSKTNVNIVYQACLVYQQYLAWILQLERIIMGKNPIRSLCWSVVCKCVQPIDEEFDDIAPQRATILPENKGNDLLWVSKSDLIVHHSTRLKSYTETERVAVEDFHQDYLQAMFHVYMGKRIAQDVYSGDLTEDVEARMVESVSKYPRVYYSKMEIGKLVDSLIVWLKVFLVKRHGPIGRDIRVISELETKVREKLSLANPICYQGLGLFFTNRTFCEHYLPLTEFPRPTTYPYTIRSVGSAMKEFVNDYANKGHKSDWIPRETYPIEFSNIEDEMLNTAYFRVLSRGLICIRCLQDVSNLSSNPSLRKCTEHNFYEDLHCHGKWYPKFIPVTIDRLSKMIQPLSFEAKTKRKEASISVPRCRVLMKDVTKTIRAGNDQYCDWFRATNLPIMGSVWQKYVRAANQPTASRYKWTCVIAELKRSFSIRDTLIFGDGLGGVSNLFNLFFPSAQITIISFMDVADAINHATIGCVPPEYQGDQEMLDVYFQTNRVNDVTSSNFQSDWEEFSGTFSTVISDVELPRDVDNATYMTYVENIVSLRADLLVLKTYLKDLALSINVLAAVGTSYHNVDVVSSSVANLHYNEVFLICSRRKDNEGKWMFSLPSFSQKLNSVLINNGPETWMPFKEALSLETCYWIRSELQRSYRTLYQWYNRVGFTEVLLTPEIDLDTILRHSKRAMANYRRQIAGKKAKIPYHIIIQLAQRFVAIFLTHVGNKDFLRRIMSDPSVIEITVNNTWGHERFDVKFTEEPNTNSEKWDQTMRVVATGRRLLNRDL